MAIIRENITGAIIKDIKKSVNVAFGTADLASKVRDDEEWIWVEGYKGTESDMKCRDQQYEIGKTYVMPEGSDIKLCESGFHFCLGLIDVFSYYAIGRGRRYFKVKALVRKSDFENAAAPKTELKKNSMFDYWAMAATTLTSNTMFVADKEPEDKLTAKSIEFIRELTVDEIFANTYGKDWSEEDKKLALEQGMDHVYDLIEQREREIKQQKQQDELVELGYSRPFAAYIVKNGYYDEAYAVGTQSDLSMDMKVLAILKM